MAASSLNAVVIARGTAVNPNTRLLLIDAQDWALRLQPGRLAPRAKPPAGLRPAKASASRATVAAQGPVPCVPRSYALLGAATGAGACPGVGTPAPLYSYPVPCRRGVGLRLAEWRSTLNFIKEWNQVMAFSLEFEYGGFRNR